MNRATDLFNADLHYRIKLNGTIIADYYHAGVLLAPSQFPTVDLAQFPSAYNDTPGATNTVEMENLGSVNLILDTTSQGGIDIYRFYKSKNICQDDFSNPSYQSTYFWNTVSNNGGSVDIANNQLQVTVPCGGTGWCQAGKITRHACDVQAFYPGSNVQGFEAMIDVVSMGQLSEMNFLIGSDTPTINDNGVFNQIIHFKQLA